MKKILLALVMCGVMTSLYAQWQGEKAEYTESDGVITVKSSVHQAGIAQLLKVEAKRRYVLSFEASGEGKVCAAIFGSPTTMLSPTLTLGPDQWEKFELSYYASENQISLKIFSLETNPTPFKIRNFTVTPQDKPKLKDREIVRLDFEARRYLGGNGKEVEMTNAVNGIAVWGKRWYVPIGALPVPATTRSLYYWGRFRKDLDSNVTVLMRNRTQTITLATIDAKDQWEWVKFPPVSAEAIYPEISFSYDCEPDVQIWVDRIAVSTDPAFVPDNSSIATSEKGVVAVGQTGSVKIEPFILHGENRFAQEQTELTFRYDHDKFYATFTCYESCLDPVNNRLHEFRSSVKERDDNKIYNDDCVVLLLQPLGSGDVYEFTVNANGTLLDARCHGADLWSGRELEWNSGTTATAEKSNGYWMAELAIPFKAIRGDVPQIGERWKVMAGRIEKSSGETSSWQPTRIGFHSAPDFGELIFLKFVPNVKVKEMPKFTSGKNLLDVEGASGVEVESAIRFSGKNQRYFRGKEFDLDQSGTFNYGWLARDLATLSVYYQSPTYELGVRSTLLTYDTNNLVRVNGVDETGQAMLNDGHNKVEIQSPFKGEFEVAGFRFPPPNETFTLLVNDSTVWPNWLIDGLSVCRGSIQQVLFQVQGIEGYTLDDYTLYLDLPPDFVFEGASGYYNNWQLETEKVGAVKIGNSEYLRYSIRFKNNVKFTKTQPEHQHIAVLFRAPKTGVDKSQIYFHAGSEKQKIVEVPQKIEVTLLQPLAGKRPKKLLVQMWTGWLKNFDNQELQDKFQDHFIAMGVNETGAYFEGLRNLVLIDFQSWNLRTGNYLASNPDTALVDSNGKRSAEYVCTSVLLEDPSFGTWFDAEVAHWLEKRKYPAHVDWDYEGPVLKSYISCFCPRCLARFGKGDPKQHLTEWTVFMNRRMAEIATKLNAAIKKDRPETLFSVYSGYHSEDTKRHYGVDWSMLAGKIDLAMCGYGRPERDLSATRQALGKTPLVLGAIAYPYDVSKRHAPKTPSKATLLRRAADASQGILIYSYATLDGQTFSAISEVSAVMAQYESFFLRNEQLGDQLKIPGWDRSAYELLSDGSDSRLVLLMNNSDSERIYQFEFDGHQKSGSLKAGDIKIFHFTE